MVTALALQINSRGAIDVEQVNTLEAATKRVFNVTLPRVDVVVMESFGGWGVMAARNIKSKKAETEVVVYTTNQRHLAAARKNGLAAVLKAGRMQPLFEVVLGKEE